MLCNHYVTKNILSINCYLYNIDYWHYFKEVLEYWLTFIDSLACLGMVNLKKILILVGKNFSNFYSVKLQKMLEKLSLKFYKKLILQKIESIFLNRINLINMHL